MSSAFQNMQAVRSAFEAAMLSPADASAQAAFASAHGTYAGSYVESFEVMGVTYPRTDGHKLSEREARAVISRLLASGKSAQDFRPSVIQAAYPLEQEVLRQEVEEAVKLAKQITALKWTTDSLDAASKAAIRALLRMPTECGSYKSLQKEKKAANARRKEAEAKGVRYHEPLLGREADHLIPDKVLRGSLVRGQSKTKAGSYATWLQDSQNGGSQHKFATDAQNAAKLDIQGSQQNPVNPTVGEYLAYVFEWMKDIYTVDHLMVDIAVNDTFLEDGDEFKAFSVKGFALAQAGFMTYAERQLIGKAVATALLIDAREFYTSIGWGMDVELPLFNNVAPTTAQQPLPMVSPP